MLCSVLAAWAQDTPPSGSAATAPTTQPASAPASRPTATQAARDEQEEARLRKELAAEQAAEAETKLESVRQEKQQTESSGLRALLPDLASRQQKKLESEEIQAQQAIQLADLRKRSADALQAVAQRKLDIDEERQNVAASLEALESMSATERSDFATQFEEANTGHSAKAQQLWQQADELLAPVAALQKRHLDLGQQRATLNANDPMRATLRDELDTTELLILHQRQIAFTTREEANEEYRLADDYSSAATAFRDANRRFWIQHAYLIRVGWVVAYALAGHVGLNILTWIINAVVALITPHFRREHAVPTIKRVQTLIHFARSIVKVLIWVVALVTILAEFGISPGQSAGALGVIGLLLAGMFQQLVVDFVKGIDIAVGGHYFVGDFIQAGAHAGHVLNLTVKHTVLRAPSGQIITVPNSQCIPSRRFPAGYVDNYVDIPLASAADLKKARSQITGVGRMLNARIEAVKREPQITGTFHDANRTIVRVQIRVLPTCDWVVKEHFLPALKKRLAAAGIALDGDPCLFYLNDLPTFRRLFSRQMTDSDIAATLKEESRPTIEREPIPDAGVEPGEPPESPRAH